MERITYEEFIAKAENLAVSWERIGKKLSSNQDLDKHEKLISRELRSHVARTSAMEILYQYYIPLPPSR
jgi:hypothetical protein